MKLLLKLILREAWHHRARISLAVTATVAMSCLVVWLIGSLDLMMLQFDSDGENYLGHYHLVMIPETVAKTPSFHEITIRELSVDPIVTQVSPARQIRSVMGKMEHEQDEHAAVRRQRSILGLPTQSPVIVGIDAVESPYELAEGRWFFDDARDQNGEAVIEGVMGTGAARGLQGWSDDETQPVRLGDTVVCRIDSRECKIRIVGMVEQKLASAGARGELSPAVGAVYVSRNAAERIAPTAAGQPPQIDYVYVRLREGSNLDRFRKNWAKHLSRQGIAMRFLSADDLQEQLNRMRSRDTTAGLMGGAASLQAAVAFTTLVSILIVFTTLSMGVGERTRVFAMLRAVGMTRMQITALVFGESVILCLLGWVGGMIAGWGVLQLSVSLQPEVFGTGKTVSLGTTAVVTAGIAALAGALLAAIIPAWRAMRIAPLDGLNRGRFVPVRTNRFVIPALIGLALLIVAPLLVYGGVSGEHGALRLRWYCLLGLPTQIAGCVLLVPAMILLVEKLLVPAIALLLRLPKELLTSQLGGNLWRTFGTTVALCVGLGMYSFFEISGYSMLRPYIHSRAIPDTLVTFLPQGVPFDRISTVRETPGVDANRFLTLAVDQSRFSRRQTERFLKRGLAPMQTSAVLFGVDPAEAFGKRGDGSRPMIELEFEQGTLASALEKLNSGGRYCLVPDSFAFRVGLGMGDTLELVVPPETRHDTLGDTQNESRRDETIVEYEICGVVSIPGWIWMNKLSGVRTRGYRSGAMLLAPYAAVQNDYRIDDAAFFWFDRTLDASGRLTVPDATLEESLQHYADTLAAEHDENGVTHPMVKVSSREYLNERVGSRSDDVIQAAAKMPLILLAIASVGMMGTIAASVRVRRFELGVLRSLGVTRFALVRLILAEAILISLAAVAISVTAGTLGAWCFIGLMRYVSAFGGFASPLVIPLGRLSIGFAVTLTLCTFAALAPAASVAKEEPATLLKNDV